MHKEVHSAANFLVQLLRIKPNNGLSDFQLNMLKRSIADVLYRRYEEHWFPEKPAKGSGYRCIRINKAMDPVIAQAGLNIGLPSQYLTQMFPSELTLWIDPAEVSYRIGEDGSICVLYEAGKLQVPPAPPTQSPEMSPNSGGSNSDSGSNSPGCVPNSPVSYGSNSSVNCGSNNSTAGCKEALLILDPRNTAYSYEQTSTYVSG